MVVGVVVVEVVVVELDVSRVEDGDEKVHVEDEVDVLQVEAQLS